MTKKYIEVKMGEQVIAVSPIKECDPLEFVKIEKEAQKNAKEMQDTVCKAIETLNSRIRDLEKEIRILKGED